MKKTAVFLIIIAILFAMSSCSFGEPEMSESDIINAKINAIDTKVESFSDVTAACKAFREVFDAIHSYKGDRSVLYIESLSNKCTGFYNSYLALSEDAEAASAVIGNMYSDGLPERITNLLLNAKTDYGFKPDEAEFKNIITTVYADYKAFTEIEQGNGYFTAGLYPYSKYCENVETSILKLNSAYDYYLAHDIDTSERLSEFKQFFADSIGAMTEIARMHAATLDAMSSGAETVLTFIDSMNAVLPSGSTTGTSSSAN